LGIQISRNYRITSIIEHFRGTSAKPVNEKCPSKNPWAQTWFVSTLEAKPMERKFQRKLQQTEKVKVLKNYN